MIPNKELEALGLGRPTRQKKEDDPGSAEVTIDQTIRYRIKDPFKALSFGSIEQIERTIAAYCNELTRTIAARVEMDPLISNKSQVGKCVHKAFHSKKVGGQMETVKATIEPWMSNAACAAFVFVFAFGLPLLILDWTFIPTISVLFMMIGVGLAGWQHIEPGHMGVLTIFGKRFRSIKIPWSGKEIVDLFADEGYQWLPWPIASYIVVDMREKIFENNDVKVFAGIDPNAGDTIPDDPLEFSDQIDETYGPDSGADVLAIITENIMPTNHEIIEGREALKIEKGKSDAEDEGMRRQGLRALQLKETLGITGKDALLAVQGQEGQLERKHISVEGVGQADALIGGLVAAVSEAKGAVALLKGGQPQQGNQGKRQGKKGWRHGKRDQNRDEGGGE